MKTNGNVSTLTSKGQLFNVILLIINHDRMNPSILSAQDQQIYISLAKFSFRTLFITEKTSTQLSWQDKMDFFTVMFTL